MASESKIEKQAHEISKPIELNLLACFDSIELNLLVCFDSYSSLMMIFFSLLFYYNEY